MKKNLNRVAFFAVAAAGLLIAGCGGGGGSESLNVSEAELAGLDGAALYSSNCAGCHGSLSNSQVRGASAGKIKSAISDNSGGMGRLSSLSNAKIVAISRALNGQSPVPVPTPTPTPTPGTVDGAALYASNCAGCHGAL